MDAFNLFGAAEQIALPDLKMSDRSFSGLRMSSRTFSGGAFKAVGRSLSNTSNNFGAFLNTGDALLNVNMVPRQLSLPKAAPSNGIGLPALPSHTNSLTQMMYGDAFTSLPLPQLSPAPLGYRGGSLMTSFAQPHQTGDDQMADDDTSDHKSGRNARRARRRSKAAAHSGHLTVNLEVDPVEDFHSANGQKRRRSKPQRYGDMVDWSSEEVEVKAERREMQEEDEAEDGAQERRSAKLKRRRNARSQSSSDTQSSSNSARIDLVHACSDLDLDAIVKSQARARVQEQIEEERANAPKRQSRTVTAHLSLKDRMKVRKQRKLAQSRARRGILNDTFDALKAAVPASMVVNTDIKPEQGDDDEEDEDREGATTAGQGDVLDGAIAHINALRDRMHALHQELIAKKKALTAAGIPLPTSSTDAKTKPEPQEFNGESDTGIKVNNLQDNRCSKRVWQALVQAPPLQLALIMTAAQVQAQQSAEDRSDEEEEEEYDDSDGAESSNEMD